MRLGLYAHSSPRLGAGHVMRQLAIANDAVARGADVLFVGSIAGNGWLENRVKKNAGVSWIQTSEHGQAFRELLDLQLDAAILDSYALTLADVSKLENQIGTVASIIDGPWQQVGGRLGIAPVLDARASWLDGFHVRFDQFFAGPEFVAVREELRDLAGLRVPADANLTPEIVVAFGGGDQAGEARWVLEALAGVARPLVIKVFSSAREGLGEQMRNTHHTLQFLVPGEGFLEALLSANVVVSALGTTTFELAFLKVPAIFIPVAPNQKLNAAGVRALELGLLVNPNDGDRASQLVAAVERSLSEARLRFPSGLANLDGLGARRILDIIFD